MEFLSFHRNVKIRIIVGFFQRLISQMIIPFMAIYLANHFGAVNAGIMMLCVILSGVLVSFYGGHFSDLKGRKPILLISEFANFIIFLLMALVNSPWFFSPMITFILYAILNAFISFSKPALNAMIIDVSTPKTRKAIYSINYWTINLSFAIGAMLGAFFYHDYFFEVLLVASISTLIIFFIYYVFVSESKPNAINDENLNPHNTIKNIISSYRIVISDNVFIKFLFASIIMMGIEFQLANYISIRLTEEIGYTSPFSFIGVSHLISGVEIYGILRAENTIGVVVLGILLGGVFKLIPDYFRLYFGTLLFTVGYMFLGSSNNFWVLIIAMLIVTLGELIYVPIQQTILSVIIDQNNRTRYMAVFGLNQNFGMMIASFFILIGGLLPQIVISGFYGIMGIIAIFLFRNVFNQKSYIKKMDSLIS